MPCIVTNRIMHVGTWLDNQTFRTTCGALLAVPKCTKYYGTFWCQSLEDHVSVVPLDGVDVDCMACIAAGITGDL